MLPLEEFVRSALGARYAAPVMRADGDVVYVLDGKPLAAAREDALAAGYGDAHERIQPLLLESLAWVAVPEAGLRLWRQHGQAEEAGELVTELVAGDPPLQLLAEHDGWVLARACDGAAGWLTPEAASLPFVPAAAVEAAKLAAVPVPGSALATAAASMLGVPYVWGGTTDRGIDCSGLAQRAAWQAGGAWLPRHSTALLRVGRRVGGASVDAGDILVLKRLPGGAPPADDGVELPPHGGPRVHPMHVAVAVGPQTVVHASRDAWQVIQEPLAALRERYRVLSIRRLDGQAASASSPSIAAAKAVD